MVFNILDYKSKEDIINMINDMWNKKLLSTGHGYDGKDITILEKSKYESEHYTDEAKKTPAIALLTVILAARNNFQRIVAPRMKKLIENNPKLATFDQLKEIVNSKTQEEFYEFWNFRSPWKYNRIVEILNSIPLLRWLYSEAKNDYELFHSRASNIDIDNISDDILWKIKGMWTATIQHLAMNFGVNTAKPDQRVMEVLEREFNIKNITQSLSIEAMEQISKITWMSTLLLDQIFVKYWSSYYAKV